MYRKGHAVIRNDDDVGGCQPRKSDERWVASAAKRLKRDEVM